MRQHKKKYQAAEIISIDQPLDFKDSKDFVNASCDLFAANGMFFKSQKITTPITVIPCYELPTGMYFIILKNKNCKNVIKFEVIKN